MYLLATERGIDFLPVFADTGNEHEITCEFVASLPDKVGGPAIRWVKADFSDQFERKRRFIAEHWPRDLMAGTEGQWVPRADVAVSTEEVWDADCEALIEAPTVEPPDWTPSDPYMSAFTAWFRWAPGKRPLSEHNTMERVERALALLHPTGIPFLDLCMLKGRFPSTRARFCSEELKHHPIFYQVQEPLLEAGHTVVSWQGVRAEESPRRAALSKLERLGGRLVNWRPILRWTVEDVFAIHRRHGVEPNPLYKDGVRTRRLYALHPFSQGGNPQHRRSVSRARRADRRMGASGRRRVQARPFHVLRGEQDAGRSYQGLRPAHAEHPRRRGLVADGAGRTAVRSRVAARSAAMQLPLWAVRVMGGAMNSPGPTAGRTPEKTLLRLILREFGARPDIRLFRNNVGVAEYPDGSRVAYGLCPGSADLIGWRTVEITPAMVGSRFARFLAVEIKAPPGRLTEAQRNFLDAVERAGGIAVLARSPENVREALRC